MSMVQCTNSFNTLTLYCYMYLHNCNKWRGIMKSPSLSHTPTHIDLFSPTHFRREEVVSVRFVEAKNLTKSQVFQPQRVSLRLTGYFVLKRLGEIDRILNHCGVCRQCQCRCDCIVTREITKLCKNFTLPNNR